MDSRVDKLRMSDVCRSTERGSIRTMSCTIDIDIIIIIPMYKFLYEMNQSALLC